MCTLSALRKGKRRDPCYKKAKRQLVKELLWPDSQKEAIKSLWFLDLLYSLDAITTTENLAPANSRASRVPCFSHNICCQGLHRRLPGNLPTCHSEWKQQTGRQWALLSWEDISNFHPVQTEPQEKPNPSHSQNCTIWTAQSYARYFRTGNHSCPCWLASWGDARWFLAKMKNKTDFFSWLTSCCCISWLVYSDISIPA